MKRIYIIIGFVFISLAMMAQGNKVVWDYPVKPGMEEWNRLKTMEYVYKACQIPDKVLQQMNTEELVKVCLNYPILSVLLLFNSFQIGYENFYANFNGIRELMSRKDAGEYLLKMYTNMSLDEYNPLWTLENRGAFSARYLYLEIILAQPDVIHSFDENTRKAFLMETEKKFAEKMAREDIFGGASLEVNGWIMARALQAANKLPEATRQRMTLYLETGTLEDKSLLEDIYQLTKKINHE
ncbi:MAG: hypothetical protein LBJ72_09060 [Dysgonamonadaceae bacterium]|jgi:hypothetical protein|nr:hypothetical protein [Dysgonamonadaceae bacterium]